MLSREWMGLFALGVLWVNVLLVAAAAVGRARTLLSRATRMARDGLVVGQATGEVGAHITEQVGRRASDDADRPAILFHDRGHSSELGDGAIGLDDATLALQAPAGRFEIWLPMNARMQAAGCPDDATFDAAHAQASRARGFERTVRATLASGERIWAHARRRGSLLVPHDGMPLLISTMEPVGHCVRRAALLIGFALACIVTAGGITALTITPPLFGAASKAGAILGLAFFLLVQPAANAVRDAVLDPHRAFLRGVWVRARRKTPLSASR